MTIGSSRPSRPSRASDRVDQRAARQPGPALAWSIANTALARFGTLAIGIALARMLGPEEFGTYAVAFVALMAILSFNELGVSLAVVRWQTDPAEIAPTVTTISLGMSAVLTALAVLVGPAFARAMGDPGAGVLVQLLSLCVLINGAVATPAALMQRLFRQDQRMVADQVNVWVGAGVSLAVAATGVGAAALVAGRLAGAGLSALLFWHYSPLPYRLGWDREQARHLIVFGLPLAGASVIVFMVGFVDQLVVGHVLGSVALGAYVLAANLAMWPVSMFSQPLRSVAPALFARLQEQPHRMGPAFGQVLRPLAAVAVPACLAIAVTAPQIVAFVYGPDWAPAAEVLRWLALLALLRILFELSYDYLVVCGRSGTILRLQVAWIVALVPVLWVAVEEAGLRGAGLAMVAVAAVISLPLYLHALRGAGVPPGRVLASCARAVLASALLVAGAVLVCSRVPSTFGALAVVGSATVATAGALLWLDRDGLAVFRLGRAP